MGSGFVLFLSVHFRRDHGDGRIGYTSLSYFRPALFCIILYRVVQQSSFLRTLVFHGYRGFVYYQNWHRRLA